MSTPANNIICKQFELELVIVGLILIGCQCLYRSTAEKNHSESDSNDIVSLCLFVWTLLFFNIENDFQNYIFIVIVIDVNGPLSHDRFPPLWRFFFVFVWDCFQFQNTTQMISHSMSIMTEVHEYRTIWSDWVRISNSRKGPVFTWSDFTAVLMGFVDQGR